MINAPLKYYTDDKSLRFHILNVGEGLMILLIFPNNEVMLFDCNVTEDNADEILNYLDKEIPIRYDEETEENHQYIDIFVNSHRDDDHLRGLKKVDDNYEIKQIWDSGQCGDSCDSSDYNFYMQLRRDLKNKNSNNVLEVVASSLPIINISGANVYCLSSKKEIDSDTIERHHIKKQHTNSIVLKIEYANKSILLTGDSDWYSWKNYISKDYKYIVKSDILIASHHGSRSFFTSEDNENIDADENPDTTYLDSIDYINPDIVLISCGEYDSKHHPNKEAVNIYSNKSKNKQVYTTNNCGNFCGFIDCNGNYTAIPSRFVEKSSILGNRKVDINCLYKNTLDSNSNVANDSVLKIGGDLIFTLSLDSTLITYSYDVEWEVSNGGILEYSDHQEIYTKRRNENNNKCKFERKLSYKGTHLLRCTFKSRYYGIVTKIFKIKGI